MLEVYLQHIENTYLKQAMDNKEIVYYRRYVDDLFLIYDETKISADTILQAVNKLDRNLTFKVETEEKMCHKLPGSKHKQNRQQVPSRHLQKIHCGRHHYKFRFQPPLYTKTNSFPIFHPKAKQPAHYTRSKR
jgi:hypothetical protein